MGNSDFQERIARISKSANQWPVAAAEVKKVRLTPQSSDIGKYLWGAFGLVWGLIATVMVMFSSASYGRAWADIETPEMFMIVIIPGVWLVFRGTFDAAFRAVAHSVTTILGAAPVGHRLWCGSCGCWNGTGPGVMRAGSDLTEI